ncbi:MFS transporter [Acetonema longum]|uniref:Major facilitator transporter n=1 Tax=Acetonema longum DSM 6540 TaxID=1009370 RepID=F7NDK2_9FIRM|nr:MFS transporter [Acetonema longum]EGO65864.1 major facilitator transporter [Acetonema longum DSM 6540]
MPQMGMLFANRQFQNIAVSQMLTTFASNLLVPVLPVYLKLQNFSDTQIGLIMGIAALGALLIRPLAGIGVDVRGSKPVLLVGQVMIGLCLAAYLWVSSFFAFVVLRLGQGIAVALYGTGAVTFASSVETRENTASAISMYAVCTMVGVGVATSIGPFFFAAMGFQRLILISLAILAIAVLVMTLRAAAIAPMTGVERTPVMDIMRSKDVMAPTICLFASNFASITTFTFVPLIALAEGGIPYFPFFFAFMVAVISARLGVQYITKLWPAERAATYASLLNVGSVAVIAIHPSTMTFILSGILVGLGFGVIFPSLAVYVVEHTNPANKGTALGTLSTAGDVGNAMGAAVLGVVADTFGYRVLFWVSAAVVLVCTYYFYMTLVQKAQAVEQNA